MINIAIGDIHGCLNELKHLTEELKEYQNRDDVRWIFLGDYVDRGPDVKGVVDFLIKFRETNNCVFLKGNHEDMMIEALHNGRDDLAFWTRNGGGQTLESYPRDGKKIFPDDHWSFYNSLVTKYETETHFFCHAGVHPAYDLDNQLDSDLMWIRQSFLYSDHDWGKIIVHGHTPRIGYPYEIEPNRINLDTGCVFGGWLTAGIFEDEKEPKIVQVKSDFAFGKMMKDR